MNKDYTQDIAAYFQRLKSTVDRLSLTDINQVMTVLEQARDAGKMIFRYRRLMRPMLVG